MNYFMQFAQELSTVRKRNYFMGCGILLHEVEVVVTQSNTVVHVLELQNLDVVKYGITFVK